MPDSKFHVCSPNVVCSLIIFLFLKISHVNKKHQAHEKKTNKPKTKTKKQKQKHTPFSYPTNQGLGVSSDVTVKVHILTLRRADCCTGQRFINICWNLSDSSTCFIIMKNIIQLQCQFHLVYLSIFLPSTYLHVIASEFN